MTARKPADDATVLDAAMRALASAGPTATGATLLLPDGEVRYIGIAEARAATHARAAGRPQ